jgi:hypothetical protein
MTTNLLMISLVSLLLSLFAEAERNNPRIQALDTDEIRRGKASSRVCIATKPSLACDYSDHP